MFTRFFEKTILILSIILFAVNQEVTAGNFYEKGDTLNVWAVSGLNMREGPGTDFPKIKKLEYGEQVEVVDKYLRSTPLNLTIVKKKEGNAGFVLKGHWVRVKTGTQEGYIFDGYLSKLPVLKIRRQKAGDIETWYSEGLVEYMDRAIGIDTNRVDTLDSDYHLRTIIKAKKHFRLEHHVQKCFEGTTIVEGFSKQDAYLFFNVLYRIEEIQRLKKIDAKRFDYLMREIVGKNGSIIFSLGEELWECTIYYKNGKWIISEFACC